MTIESIPESRLQAWFEHAVERDGLACAIQNVAELEERLEVLRAAGKVTDYVARDGLENALDIYGHLCEAESLSANESIALAGYNQMRPDLVLHTSSAHYILVELKTKAGSERQGVQELLAYSAAIKMAMPYANETLYIIVASAWDALLQFSVRALILDGKRVLPLQWTHLNHGAFEFNIRLDLFDFNFIEAYDPFYAFSVATFACMRPASTSAAVDGYFGWHASQASADCRRVHQCGFSITWFQGWPDGGGILNTSLITFNQHWRESEYLPPDFEESSPMAPNGLVKVIHNAAMRRCDVLDENNIVRRHGADELDEVGEIDIYGINEAYYERKRHFPQNGASYEMLERRRSRLWESSLSHKDRRVAGFETRDAANLKKFISVLEQDAASIDIWHMAPFGEFFDFARSVAWPGYCDVYALVELLYSFREFKGYPDSRPKKSSR